MSEPKYKPVGRCIYCGAYEHSTARAKLGREHIILEGLDGKLILPEASCGKCEDITKNIGGFCQRHTLAALRYKFNLPTKRSKDRPTTLPVRFLVGGAWHTHQVPVKDYPLLVSMPYAPRPSLLNGTSPSNEYFRLEACDLYFTTSTQIKRLRRRYGATHVSADSGVVRMDMLGRLIGKIGHAYATATLGYGMFRPLLLDIINGNMEKAPYLIGGYPKPVMAVHNQHILGLQTVERSGKLYIVVGVRLFADLGFPLYICIAGEVNSGEQDQ